MDRRCPYTSSPFSVRTNLMRPFPGTSDEMSPLSSSLLSIADAEGSSEYPWKMSSLVQLSCSAMNMSNPTACLDSKNLARLTFSSS